MNQHFRYTTRARQRGQAMVEFLVAAIFFLVPLFLALVVMGKLSDVRHTANMAGRYGAWERTVWYDDAGTQFGNLNGANHKSAAEISNEIAVRLINDHSLATSVIKNTDRSATTFANGIDPMWHDNEGRAYLDRYDQQSTSIARQTPTTDVAGAALALIGSVSIPGVVGSIVPPVPRDTLAVASVSFGRVAQSSQAYQRLWPKLGVWVDNWAGLDFASTGAILSNTWYANGATSTEAMVKESVPMSKGLGTIAGTAAMTTMRAWNLLGGPNAAFGKVAPDVVPADRLR
jgi:hypothetical protein